jgi:hypothetical protein
MGHLRVTAGVADAADAAAGPADLPTVALLHPSVPLPPARTDPVRCRAARRRSASAFVLVAHIGTAEFPGATPSYLCRVPPAEEGRRR